MCKIYSRVGFIEALDSKGIINTLKRYYVAMESADVVAFTFPTWQIRSCILCELILQFCEYHLWVKANEVNYFAVSSQQIQRSYRRSNVCKPRKNMSDCKDYVNGREITTELKITVDNAILELCESCDFFASPLIKWSAVVSTVINESSRTALECALRSSKTFFFHHKLISEHM